MSDSKEIDLDEFVARNEANRHLALYRKTKEDQLIWRAYLEFRKLNLTIPEEILKALDILANAGTPKKPKKINEREIVEYMHTMKIADADPELINREAAKKFNKSVSYVKKIYSEWKKETEKGLKKKTIDDANSIITRPWK